MNSHGLLTCSRYAFPPNSLHYCGPEKQSDLAGYQKEYIADSGLTEIIQKFETLYPYLTLIAHENNIADPFDPRVVEAYWIGNSLLNNIKINNFYHHLHDSLGLKKKVKPKDLEYLYGKLPSGLLPHHTFHVLNIFNRTGHHSVEHTLETMDSCRIGWGKVVQGTKLSHPEQSGGSILVVTQPLILQSGKLALGKPIIKKINIPFTRTSKIAYQPSFISFHWNTSCDQITEQQAVNLKKYTEQAIRLANTTL